MATAILTWTPASTTGSQTVYYKPSSASTYTVYSTLSATANTETVVGLSDDIIYNFKVENNCGGTATFVTMDQINIICPSFMSITPLTTSIAYNFISAAAPADIASYVVELLDASNNVITSTGFFYTPSSINSGSFTGLTPGTTYGLRITVYAGTFNKICAISSTTTTVTLGFYVTNVDYTYDSICPAGGDVGVGLRDMFHAVDILGDTSPGNWNGSNYVAAGQTIFVTPIPTGDDFRVAGYRGCPTTATIGLDSWIQLQDNTGTVIDLDLSSSEKELPNVADITGFGIANGWHIYVRKPGIFAPFRIDIDSNPSGGTYGTDLLGFIQVPMGTARERFANGSTAAISGQWDVYHTGVEVNPFGTINSGNILVGPAIDTPDGIPVLGSTPTPIFMNIAGQSWYLTSDTTKTKGEQYQSFSMASLQNPNNIGIISVDRSALRNHPVVNSVTNSGGNITITYTWTAGSSGLPAAGAGTFDFYLVLIKDRGLVTETVSHYPLTVTWNPNYNSTGSSIIPLSYTVPVVSTVGTVHRTILIPPTYTTLELRVTTLVNFPTATSVDEILYSRSTLHTI